MAIMRQARLCLAVLALVGITQRAVPVAAQQQREAAAMKSYDSGGLLRNGGFEEHKLGWNSRCEAVAKRVQSANGHGLSKPKQGKWMLHFKTDRGRKGCKSGTLSQKVGNLEAEVPYHFKVYVWMPKSSCTTDNNSDKCPQLTFILPNGAALGAGTTVTAVANQWNLISGTVYSTGGEVTVNLLNMRPGVDLYIDDFSLRRCGMDDFRPVARARTDQVRRRIVQVKLGSKGRRVLETSVVRRRTRSKKGKKHGGTAKITMVKHEFPFGAAMKSDCLGNDNCMNFFRKNFNHIVPETGAKWHDEEPNKGDFTGSGDFILEASKKLQYPMRAHCEFWENDSVIQDWVKNLPRDGSEGSLQWAIWDRIKWYTDRYKEKADIFDVANEMLHNAWYIDALPCKGGGPCMCDYGPACPNDMNVPNNIDVYSWMYRATSYYAPNRVMALNDFCLTHYCSKHFAMSSMVKEARHIKAATQMGAQGHLNRGRTICGFDLMERFDHAVAAANFKNAGGSLSQAQIMKLKKKIYITEHDVQDTDLSKRADGYETMYRAAYASAGVAGINIWGYRQGDEWRPDIAMVDHDYQLTLEPGQRIFGDKGLLHDEWNSSVKAAKIKGGAVKFKAFPGEYTIQVKGCRGRFTVPVGMGGMSVTVRNWKCKGRRTKRNLKLPQPGEGLVDAGTAADVQVEV